MPQDDPFKTLGLTDLSKSALGPATGASPETTPFRIGVDAPQRVLFSWLKGVNPVTAFLDLASHPVQQADDLLAFSKTQADAAVAAWKEGRHTDALGLAATVVPFLGPMWAGAKEQADRGDWAGATGTALASLTPFAAHAFLPKTVAVPGIARSKNPELARASDMALAEGVPLGLAEASGNKWLSRMTFGLDAGTVAGLIDRETPIARGYTNLGKRIINETRPGTTTTPEVAGTRTRQAMQAVVQTYENIAKPDYQIVETAMDHPSNRRTVPLVKPKIDPKTNKVVKVNGIPQTEVVMTPMASPIDLAPAKAKLQAVYDRMNADPKYTDAIKASDPMYNAVRLIVDGPDYAPMSQVRPTAAMFGRESVASGALNKRTGTEGMAAKIFRELKDQIEAKAQQMGPDVYRALKDADLNWTKARGIADTMEEVQKSTGKDIVEPVGLFNKLVQPGDANIRSLSFIHRHAPGVLPEVGRAWLEDMLTDATTHGSLDYTQSMLTKWDQLGDKTKALMFPNPATRLRVNDLMVSIKQWGKSPNASNTGAINAMMDFLRKGGKSILGVGEEMRVLGPTAPEFIAGQVLGSAADMALHSPTVARVLTQGGRMPVRMPVAAAAGIGVVGNTPPIISHEKASRGWAAGELKAQIQRDPTEEEITRFLSKYPYTPPTDAAPTVSTVPPGRVLVGGGR